MAKLPAKRARTGRPRSGVKTTNPDHRAAFLAALAECGNARDAARQVGLSRSTVYQWRDTDAVFADAWAKAQRIGVEALEDEARRRAYSGVEEPVYQGGKLVGHVRKYSDTLLIFLLKGAKPETYRDNARIEHTGKDGGPIRTEAVADMEAARRIAFLLAQAAQGVLPPPAQET